jgi:hypothetical protein
MGTFTTTEGYTGYASEGFHSTEKNSGVTAIYKGKKKKQGSILIYKKGQEPPPPPPPPPPKEYTIKDAQGQPVKVTVKPESSYKETQLAQQYKADISTEEARRILEQQGGKLPRQRIEVAVSSENVESFNQAFKEAGISSAGELIKSLRSGEAKIQDNGSVTITKTQTVTSEQPALEMSADLNKRNFGAQDYFEKIGSQGYKELRAGVNKRFLPAESGMVNLNPEFDTKMITGGAKLVYGILGAGASSIIEPVAWALLGKRRASEGAPETDLETYKMILEKEKAQEQIGALQLSNVWAGLRTAIKPTAQEEYLIIPQELDTKYRFRAPTITERGIERGLLPETTGTTREASGLMPLKEIQTQIIPKPLIEPESIFAPEKYVPEAHLKLARMKYQSSFGLPGENIPAITPEETIKIFRQETPGYTQADLTLNYEQKILLEPYYKEGTIKLSQKLIGNKKGQASTITEFNKDIYEKYPGTTINKFKPSINPADLGTSEELGTNTLFIPVAIDRTIGRIKPLSQIDTSIYLITGDKTISKEINIGKIFVDQSTEQIQEQNVYQIHKPKTIQKTILKPLTQQETIMKEEQITTPINKINYLYRPRTSEPEKPTPPPSILKKPRLERKDRERIREPGFNVLIKNKGIFNKINTKPISKAQAINLGAGIVEKTSSATFTIKPSNSPAQKISVAKANLKNFYKKGSLFIEKPSKRINTPGELTGITFKGIKSKKLKKLFG